MLSDMMMVNVISKIVYDDDDNNEKYTVTF